MVPAVRGPWTTHHVEGPGLPSTRRLTGPPLPPGSPGVIETCPAGPAGAPGAHRPCGRIRWCLSPAQGQLGEEPHVPGGSGLGLPPAAARPSGWPSSRSLGAGEVRGGLLLPCGLQAGLLAWPAVVQPGKPGRVLLGFTASVTDQDTQARLTPDPHPCRPWFPTGAHTALEPRTQGLGPRDGWCELRALLLGPRHPKAMPCSSSEADALPSARGRGQERWGALVDTCSLTLRSSKTKPEQGFWEAQPRLGAGRCGGHELAWARGAGLTAGREAC